jgi:hypothetical protein
MPKRYTSRELIKLVKEFGWELMSIKGDHHNFKHDRRSYGDFSERLCACRVALIQSRGILKAYA